MRIELILWKIIKVCSVHNTNIQNIEKFTLDQRDRDRCEMYASYDDNNQNANRLFEDLEAVIKRRCKY